MTAGNSVFAAGQDRGGGDLCEDQIKIIRADLKKWIINDGHKDLKLPSFIDYNSYATKMLSAIDQAKLQCVGTQDKGYPVQVEGVAKVCRFDVNASQSMITCDLGKFKALSETEQYVLVHHEYAGIAGIEIPNKADSNYEVSNQISGYLVDQVVKRLAVKRSTSIGSEWKPFPRDRASYLSQVLGVSIRRQKDKPGFICTEFPVKVSTPPATPQCQGSSSECRPKIVDTYETLYQLASTNYKDQANIYTATAPGKAFYMFHTKTKADHIDFNYQLIYTVDAQTQEVTHLKLVLDGVRDDGAMASLGNPDSFQRVIHVIAETECRINK